MSLLNELRKPSITGRGASHQASAPLLEVCDLALRYETGSVLEGLSFQLDSGERVAVVGPNGAGKSTLFKIIAGIVSPTSGAVNIRGTQPGGHLCIAYVPQRSQVDWNFPVTVTDVVMMGRVGKLGLLKWPKRQDWSYMRQALSEVGMLPLAQRQISELSGGQQQRMFIARALAQEAELILMDEPLNGLDIQSQESIFTILDDLRQRRVTVLVATHDLDQAAGRFDRVLLLNRRLLGFGSPAEVFTSEKLIQAYGGHLHLLPSGDSLLALTDTCCDEGESE